MSRLLLCFGTLLFFLSTSTHSQSFNTRLSEDYLDSISTELNLPGISSAVAMQDSIVFSYSKGFADLEAGVNASSQTVYPIASVSKVLTTTLMMGLVSDGILSLDTPINRYIDYPNSDELTLRHLATHTSGIRHYFYRENTEEYHSIHTLSDALTIFVQDTLLFEPGSAFNYSSYGINLIGFVMERVTNKSFDQLISKRILQPLNLESTFMAPPNNRLASSYNSGNERIQIPSLRFNVAGGGMYSNTTDLVWFGQAILSNSLIEDELSDMVFSNHTLVDGSYIEYGVGWIVTELKDGSEIYYHGGHLDGAHSLLLLVPEHNLSLAILTNRGSRFGVEEGLKLICIFTTDSEDCLELPEEEQLDQALIMEYFQTLSTIFTNFQQWFNSGNRVSINRIISPGFVSPIWENKEEFLTAVESEVFSVVPFDVDVSLQGYDEGGQAFISSLQIPELSANRSFYLELTLTNGKWSITGLKE